MIRESNKLNAPLFLKMLLHDQLQYDNPSLQQHTFGLEATDDIKISKEGLNKRFKETTVAFTQKILTAYMAYSIDHGSIATVLQDKFTAIRLLDSTEFKLPDRLAAIFPGYSSTSAASCASIQFEYDILSKRICSLELGSAKQSDKTFADKRMDNIKAGELIIRDLGYYSVDSYKKIEDSNAFYISRLKSQIKIYEKQGGQYVELDLTTLIKRIKKVESPTLIRKYISGLKKKRKCG